MLGKIIQRIYKKSIHSKEAKRNAYISFIGMLSIASNILLFLSKCMVAAMTGSVAVMADAVNNLSDSATSLVSYIGIQLSKRPADEKHPFGHARYEYIVSMVVACCIILLGVELLQSSYSAIRNPKEETISMGMILVLLFSIGVKIWLYYLHKSYGKKFQSPILLAAATDCFSDCIATTSVIISKGISYIFAVSLDGYVGMIVSIFILISGGKIALEMLDRLLGRSPSKEDVQEITNFIESYEGVLGIHDLMVHDYGGERRYASVHVEVSSEEDILKSHDQIDQIEREIQEALNVQLVIHMDPIDTKDETISKMRTYISETLQKLHQDLSIHDFRMVHGYTHTNLLFDCTIPSHVKYDNEEILEYLKKETSSFTHKYYFIVRFDRAYTSDVTM